MALSLLASWYEAGGLVPADHAMAARLYSKACDAGDTSSCVLLGIAFARGDGVDRDDDRATRLFGQACDAGEEQGCKLSRKRAGSRPAR
ncbi:MAG: hypothetical protein ACRENE_31415 [Polyangiaceae bacterium]